MTTTAPIQYMHRYPVPMRFIRADDAPSIAALHRQAVMDLRAIARPDSIGDPEIIDTAYAVGVYASEDDLVPTRYEPVATADEAEFAIRTIAGTVPDSVPGAAPEVDVRDNWTRDEWVGDAIARFDKGDWELTVHHISALIAKARVCECPEPDQVLHSLQDVAIELGVDITDDDAEAAVAARVHGTDRIVIIPGGADGIPE